MTVQYEGSSTTGVNNILNVANNVVSIAVRLYAMDGSNPAQKCQDATVYWTIMFREPNFWKEKSKEKYSS